MKIIIADEDIELIECIRQTLTRYQPDWQLLVVNSGEQCLNALKPSNYFSLIIIGMKLTDISGIELTMCIRDNSDIPIIFLSRNEDINILIKAFEAGVNDFVSLPFNKAIFIARLKAQMRRRIWDSQAREKSVITIDKN
jgi:two-component system response regulator CpxR